MLGAGSEKAGSVRDTTSVGPSGKGGAGLSSARRATAVNLGAKIRRGALQGMAELLEEKTEIVVDMKSITEI